MTLLSHSYTSNDYKGKMVPPQIIIIMITKASIDPHQNDHNDYKGKMVPHQNYYNDYKDKHGFTPASILVPLMNSATQDGG